MDLAAVQIILFSQEEQSIKENTQRFQDLVDPFVHYNDVHYDDISLWPSRDIPQVGFTLVHIPHQQQRQ